jgi:hypothetical protein
LDYCREFGVTVTSADADNFETPALHPAPKISLLRDTAHAPLVEFPIIFWSLGKHQFKNIYSYFVERHLKK